MSNRWRARQLHYLDFFTAQKQLLLTEENRSHEQETTLVSDVFLELLSFEASQRSTDLNSDCLVRDLDEDFFSSAALGCLTPKWPRFVVRMLCS